MLIEDLMDDRFGRLKFEVKNLIDGHETVPYQPGALFFVGSSLTAAGNRAYRGGGQLSGSVPNPF